MEQHTGTYEDRQDHIRALETPAIEVFRNVYADRDYRIDFEIPEFTAICPRTGLPDFGIFYVRDKKEKGWRERKRGKEEGKRGRKGGRVHENVANKVCDDLVQACQPNWLKIHADYNVRGGIKTRVTRQYRKAN